MEIQKVRDVHVLIAEGIVGSVVGSAAGRVVINLDALHLDVGEKIEIEIKINVLITTLRNFFAIINHMAFPIKSH